MVVCIWEHTTVHWWGRKAPHQKQVNTMQVAQQSHRHERQDESTESGHVHCGPHFLQQPGCRPCSGRRTLWWKHHLPESLQLWGGSSFLPLLISRLPHPPSFCPFCFFFPLIPCMESPLSLVVCVLLTNPH